MGDILVMAGPPPAAAAVTPAAGAWVSLVVMIVTAVLLTIGWRLAARRRLAAHRKVQTVAVVVNAVFVLTWMVRSFVLNVAPEIPARLGERTYAVPTAHSAIGALALVLGVFVVLSASGLLPKALRFTSYKPWMRTTYALYLLGTLGGIVVFVVAYGGSFS